MKNSIQFRQFVLCLIMLLWGASSVLALSPVNRNVKPRKQKGSPTQRRFEREINFYNIHSDELALGTASVSCSNDKAFTPAPPSIAIGTSCNPMACSTVGATPSSSPIAFICGATYNTLRMDDDVWFRLIALSSQPITIYLVPTSNLSAFDPVMGIYSGQSLSNLVIQACADANPSGGSESLTFTPVAGTTYLIRVFSYSTSSSGSGNFDICVTQGSTPPTCTPPSAPIVSSQNICSGQSALLVAAGAGTGEDYRWYSSPTSTTVIGTGSNFNTGSLNQNANYYASIFKVANPNCESSRTAVAVNVTSPSINISVLPSNNITAGQTVVFNATGAQNIVWNGPTIVINNTPFVGIAGIYTATGNSNGCTATGSVILTVNGSNLNASGSVLNATVCQNDPNNNLSCQFTAAGGTAPFVFNYRINNGQPISTPQSSGQFTLQVPVSYNSVNGPLTVELISVTDAIGTQVSVGQILNFTVLPVMPLTVNVDPDYVRCAGDSLKLTAYGTNLSWSGPTTIQNGMYFTPTATGTYTVNGIDNQGCPAQQNVTVIVYPLPVVNIQVQPGNTIVAGNTINLCASGGVSYQWAPAVVVNCVPFVPQQLGNGTYSVTVTDQNGCVNNSSTSINTSLLSASVLTSKDSICQNSTHGVQFTGSGGALPYEFTFEINGINQTVISAASSISVGVNTQSIGIRKFKLLSIKEGNGAIHSIQDSIEIYVKPAPVLTLSALPSASICAGDTVNLQASGSNNLIFTPPNIQNNIPFVPSQSATYSVSGIDNGCSGTAAIQIQVIPRPATPSINQNGNFLLSSSPIGNEWSFNYIPLTNEVNPTINTGIYGSGIYTVRVKNQQGCISESSLPYIALEQDFESADIGLTIFPNPFKDQFTLQASESGEYEFYSADGRIIQHGNLDSGSSTVHIEQNLTPGVYLLKLVVKDHVIVRKLIKD